MSTLERLQPFIALMRLDRPIGIWLLLWPTLWAVWIAGDGHPSWHIVVIFTLGVVLMRSAGCVINDYADRGFDGAVERTKNRPLDCNSSASGFSCCNTAASTCAALCTNTTRENKRFRYFSMG